MKVTAAFHVIVSLAAFASAAEVTPIGKVAQMLKDMKSKGEKDMQEEQVQYAAFEQFCESTATGKQRSIDEAKDLVEVLEAKLIRAMWTQAGSPVRLQATSQILRRQPQRSRMLRRSELPTARTLQPC